MSLLLSLVSSLVLAAHAEPRADPVSWTVGTTEMAGYVVYDDASKAPRPGLVMVPNWMGVTSVQVEKAKTIAGKDYVVLLADVYGKDVRPTSSEEASAAAGAMYGDRPKLRERVNAAVATLKAQAGTAPVDVTRIGAIGFCFGGSTVLELARSGADVAGVVSFHGGLAPGAKVPTLPIKASVLVLNGAADKNVSAADKAALAAELDKAGADWQLVDFSRAVHCFAEVGANGGPNCQYDARAATRAYTMMNAFFAEKFAQ